MTTEDTTAQAQDEADEAAFAAAFDNTEPAPAASEPAPTETPAPAAEATTEAEPRTEESTTPEADPFKDLPPAVRDLLAEIPTLRSRTELAERQARESAGRVSSLQSRFDKLNQHSPTDAPAPAGGATALKLAKVEALRAQGLPEIADAIEELAAAALRGPAKAEEPAAAPEPAPAAAPTAQPEPAQAVDPQQEVLDELRPTWAEDIVTSDFQLWLATKPKDYAQRIAKTDKAKDILGALSEFDKSKAARTTTPAPQPPARGARMAAALVPQGDGRRPSRGPAVEDEDAAFAAGFNAG